MTDLLMRVPVTAVCRCGVTWRCETAIRADIAARRPEVARMASCPLCTDETATQSQENDDG